MPRYIDADKFIKQFERALEHQQKCGLYNHAKLTEYVINAIKNEPTADVAPKTETAREIFAEIESELLNHVADYHGCYHRTFDRLKEKYCGEVAPDTNDGRKKTNFDRIKEMSADELAALLGKVSICAHIQYEHLQFCEKRGSCTDCAKEWLESEVKT